MHIYIYMHKYINVKDTDVQYAVIILFVDIQHLTHKPDQQ